MQLLPVPFRCSRLRTHLAFRSIALRLACVCLCVAFACKCPALALDRMYTCDSLSVTLSATTMACVACLQCLSSTPVPLASCTGTAASRYCLILLIIDKRDAVAVEQHALKRVKLTGECQRTCARAVLRPQCARDRAARVEPNDPQAHARGFECADARVAHARALFAAMQV